MAKVTTTLMILLFVVYGQAQVDDTIYLTAISEVHSSEDRMLDDIENKQLQISYASTAMSVSGVLMSNTEQKLHKGLILVYDIIDNAEVILQIIKTSKEIMDIQDLILEESRGNDEIMVISAGFEIAWMRKASAILLQLLMSTKEAKFSIMSNAQRLQLLHNTADSLKEIKAETLTLYSLVKSMKNIDLLEATEVIITVNFERAIQEMEQQIEELVRL